MANTRSLSTAAPLTAASGSATAAAPVAVPSPGPSPRHRLRAVGRDEVVDITEFLPPGATWLPAPQHALPTLPGRPPMIGYLVLVPADQQPPVPTAPPAPSVSPVEVGGDELVRVDTTQRTAQVDGRPLDLTYLEFELLAHLVAHPGRVHTRDQLVTTVWGYGHVGDGRTVDVHIARLRRKLGAEYRQAIQTVRRVGYKYTPPLGR
ncbi:winged helix-turn-helix domain-containing protein [Streptomyces caniscabiei]|uniref:winged helix-turn-helix domain-containing protein n=1 Tax=Streptomyces caniscabiei TaxID=2746961 RepID=UPI0029A39289|nr:winged helix-turn-helix domain-containing protein [Streptomyces caniscabiei]MDX2599093.1 winged helix-turn-helix domain-containing protein [Streptomyces caniscabiei]MDX2736563.1 winged helix-turn-helix domain-containing protein [Streptomyces caniscabiei]